MQRSWGRTEPGALGEQQGPRGWSRVSKGAWSREGTRQVDQGLVGLVGPGSMLILKAVQQAVGPQICHLPNPTPFTLNKHLLHPRSRAMSGGQGLLWTPSTLLALTTESWSSAPQLPC